MPRRRSLALFVLVLGLALVAGACGGGGGDGGGGGTTEEGAGAVKSGGAFRINAESFEWTGNFDPTGEYLGTAFGLYSNLLVRTLLGYKHVAGAEGNELIPDLATDQPEVSEDGLTYTFHLKDGVKFGPPISREITSQDVAYAFKRIGTESIVAQYGFYYTVIEGMEEFTKAGGLTKAGNEISGITTPDDKTIVFKLSRPEAVSVAAALVMPITMPVPEEYAKKFDAKNPSTYGQNQVATGPYMIENDESGKAIGYQAGRRIHLVRNPNWDRSTDYKPAYLDEIDMPQGNDDTNVASQRILDGQSMLSGDFSPPPAILSRVVRGDQKDQLELVPAGGGRYVSMNTTVKPFDDVNVRKAVVAGFDRNAMRLTRGGELVGDIPTHILPPGVPGFEEAGGMQGPGLDFLSKPAGDLALAAEYFKKAGYASGKYEGDDELLMIGTSEGVAQQAAEVTKEQFEKLGFKIRLRLVTQDAMYTKYCNVPAANVAICPNVGWFKDFADAQTLLGPTFDGDNIIPQNNSNWSELDDPAINKAMDDAALLTDPQQRADAWAKIDRMVTEQAPVIPWIWDKTPLLRSANVNGVANQFNSQWDLAWTSLK